MSSGDVKRDKVVVLGVTLGVFSIHSVSICDNLFSSREGLGGSGVVARSFSFISRAASVDCFISSVLSAFIYVSTCSKTLVNVRGGSTPNNQESFDGWSPSLRVERAIFGSRSGISVVVVLNH